MRVCAPYERVNSAADTAHPLDIQRRFYHVATGERSEKVLQRE
jgi:hypothetical protein